MNPDQQTLMVRFLNGQAKHHEAMTAEALLGKVETVIQPPGSLDTDDLLQALQADPPADLDHQQIRDFAKRIGQWLAPQDLPSDDWKRLLDPTSTTESLGRIGRFEVTQFIASGGMGLVFEAIDSSNGSRVCLKLMHPHRAHHPEARQRFELEARTATQLQHPQIVPIHEMGTQRELPYLVMPLLSGTSLRGVLLREGVLAPGRALRITRQIAQGLEHAHRLGILHRDIKPDNLWILPNGNLQILDFGLARTSEDQQPITLAGTVLGTPSYMSPEQVTGKSLDGRSDLFSLGVVLLEMLTGKSPFRRDNLFSTLMSVATDEVDVAGLDDQEKVPEPLRDLLGRLLAKDPAQRPPSATDLIQELESLEKSLQPDSSLKQSPEPTSEGRNIKWPLLVAALASGFLFWLGLGLWQLNDKGTLVVEAHDPQVEVRVRDQRVTVVDPMTNKEYTIGIGENPLPSGVYLLEASLPGEDLLFSSQTIAIRRGQQTLVTVRLLPNAEQTSTSVTATDSAIPVMDAATPVMDATAAVMDAAAADPDTHKNQTQPTEPIVPPVPRDQIADRSYAPEIQQQMTLLLPDLQPQVLDRAPEFGPAVARGATVQQPSELPGFDAWSIEPPPERSVRWQPNSNRSLWAGVQDLGLVWVCDSKRNIRCVLPTAGHPLTAVFSPVHPHLLATVSWAGNYELGDHATADRSPPYRLQLWRLDRAAATLLGTLQASRSEVVWDGSYRVLFHNGTAILAYRVDSGQTHTVIEPTAGVLLADSLSTDQRWLALRNLQGIGRVLQLYDLHLGEYVGELNTSGYQFVWHDHHLITHGNPDQNIQLWQVKPLKLVHSTPPLNRLDQQRARRIPYSQAIDAQGLRVARLTEPGELTITKLDDQQEARIESQILSGKRQQLEWTTDGTLVMHVDERRYHWQQDLSDIQGRVSEVSAERLQQVNYLIRPKKPINQHPHRSLESQNHFQELLLTHNSPLTSGRPAYRFRGIVTRSPLSIWDRGTYFLSHISPDGQYILQSESGEQRKRRWALRSTSNNELLYDFGDFPLERGPEIQFAWSDSSRWVVISGSREMRPTVVFDIESKTAFDLEQFQLPAEVASEPVDLFHPVGETFLLTFRGQSDGVWRLEPKGRAAKLLAMPESLTDFSLFQFAGPYAFFSPPSNLDAKNEVEGQRVIARAKLEGDTWTEITRMQVGVLDDMFISPTGEAYLHVVNPEGTEYRLRPGREMAKVIPPNTSRLLTIAHWPAGEDSDVQRHGIKSWKSYNRVNPPIWHESGKSVALRQSHGIAILELSTGVYSEYRRPTQSKMTQIIAGEFGWLAWHPEEFWALSHTGEKLGLLPVDLDQPPQPDGIQNWFGTWILADGRTHPNASGERYFVGRRGGQFFTVPLHRPYADHPRSDLPTYPNDASIEDLLR